MPKFNSSSAWLIGAAAAVVLLVVASVIVALTRDRGGTSFFPEDTPEGVVQRYLQAIKNDDLPAAYGYLNSDLRKACTVQNMRDNTDWFRRQDSRITLDKTQTLELGVMVQVRVTQVHADRPFVPSESSSIYAYYLEKQDGAWRFSQPPWPMSWCPGLDRKPPPPPIAVPG